jgi:pentatricopeptide repeat protein
MLNEVIAIIDKLAFPSRRHSYEMLIASLCEKNHVNAALRVLEKLLNPVCAVRISTFLPFILFYCQNNRMDKVQEVFEMMKMKGCPPDSICYNLILRVLCKRKRFAEAAKQLRSMVNIGCKPDAITYDIMIHAACMIGRIQGACELFDRLREEGINPLRGTYINLLNGLFRARGFDEAHSFLIQQSGKDRILDSIHYGYLIRVCSESGLGQEACHLLIEMKARDLELPDDQLCY